MLAVVDRADGLLRHPAHSDGHLPQHQNSDRAVIWRYNGILPEEIATRIILFSERTGADHRQRCGAYGVAIRRRTAVVKYFFNLAADLDLSMSQIVAVSQPGWGSVRRHDAALRIVL